MLEVRRGFRGASGSTIAEGESGASGNGEDSSVTLSPDQRAAEHARAFEKEFVVELNMTEAHATHSLLGIKVDIDTDFTPVSVLKVKKVGLVERWNKANPDKEVHVGDQIVKVNDILWHHNSKTFAQRIKSQFAACRDLKPGAKTVLTLAVQRPRREWQPRFAAQREDLHRQLYAKEFTVQLAMPANNGGFGNQTGLAADSFGWQLNSTINWVPVQISKIEEGGAVDQWNRDHPESVLLAGDEIVRVNNVSWHHNSSIFMMRIDQQAQASSRLAIPLALTVQRPRRVQEAFDAAREVAAPAAEAGDEAAAPNSPKGDESDEGAVGAEEDGDAIGASEDDGAIGASE